MFDIGFWELSLIGVVALLVIGPDRLPGLARKAGILTGKARRLVQTVREDIERELAADELRKVIAKHKESASAFDILDEDTRESISGSVAAAKQNLNEARKEYLLKSSDKESAESDESNIDETPPETTLTDDEQQQKRIS